jgi:hypothetical protein
MGKSVKHLHKGKKLEATKPLKGVERSSGGAQPAPRVKFLQCDLLPCLKAGASHATRSCSSIVNA